MEKFLKFTGLLVITLWTVVLGVWNWGASGGYSFFTDVFNYIVNTSSYITLGVLNSITFAVWVVIWIFILISLFKSESRTSKGLQILFSIILLVWLVLVILLNINGSFAPKFSWLKWAAPLGVENTLLWINVISYLLITVLSIFTMIEILKVKSLDNLNV